MVHIITNKSNHTQSEFIKASLDKFETTEINKQAVHVHLVKAYRGSRGIIFPTPNVGARWSYGTASHLEITTLFIKHEVKWDLKAARRCCSRENLLLLSQCETKKQRTEYLKYQPLFIPTTVNNKINNENKLENLEAILT